MRFNQLKKNPNAIIRKKLYKKGKCWVVASSLAFASGLILLGAGGMSVQADPVNNNVTQSQTVSNDNGTTTDKNPNPSGNTSDVTNGSKVADSTDGDNSVSKPVEFEQPSEQSQLTGTGTSNETSNDDGSGSVGTQQDGNDETPSAEDSAAGETQKSQDVNYDPNSSVYTDTSNWDLSNAKNTIADDQIPAQITKEGIAQRGMDGTSPYFITNAKNLYFLNGTLSAPFTHQLITEGPDQDNPDRDFMKNNVLNIDTSLAKKVYLPEDSENIFSQLGSEAFGAPNSEYYSPEYAPKLNLSRIDTSYVTSMKSMFDSDYLKEVDLSPFNTSKVTDMSAMFYGVIIPSLDLSSFDTSKVTDMSNMFNSVQISKLDLSNFDTSKVTNMSGMFAYNNYYNEGLGLPFPTLDLSNFNTTNVVDMSEMFSYAVFSSLNLKSFDTSKVTDMSKMFDNAAIPTLDLSSFNTSHVQTMKSIFDQFNTLQDISNTYYIYSPANIDVSSFKGDGLKDEDAIFNMFATARVKDINMPVFKVDSDTATVAFGIFSGITADTISIPNFDGSKIQSWSNSFTDANISKLDISTWNIKNPDNDMFDNSNIKQITLGPANKSLGDTPIPISQNNTEEDKWISISQNGVVDSPEKAKIFYVFPGEKNLGISNYDGLGGASVLSFVPDVDIVGKVTLNVPTTVDGKASEDVVYPDLYGKVGIPITLDVPAKEGYQADKKTITATVTDGKITTDDVINYTKIPTGGSSSGTSQNIFVTDRPQTSTTLQRISIYPDQGNVTLYKQEGQKFVPITDRVLAAGSDWYYDKVANVGSENSELKYYRVATNEWVRFDQAYLYQPNKVILRAKAGSPKQLIHSEGTLATSRMIGPNTEWYSDLIGDIGEGQYYRVATNEFVNKADVTVIKKA